MLSRSPQKTLERDHIEMLRVDQALCYALEKANRITVGLGHADRENAQDDYLRIALAESDLMINEKTDKKGHKPLVALALVYCLWCMDDATHDYLMGLSLTRTQRIEAFLVKFQEKCTSEIMRISIATLIAFEIERVAARHAIGFRVDLEKHEAKNFRFIIEIDALLQSPKLNSHFLASPHHSATSIVSTEESFSDVLEEREAKTERIGNMILRRIKDSAAYWAVFQKVLQQCSGAPGMLMTDTLRAFARKTNNYEPLQAWQKALAQYCENSCLSETKKTNARVILTECEEYLLRKRKTMTSPITSSRYSFSCTTNLEEWSRSFLVSDDESEDRETTNSTYSLYSIILEDQKIKI